MQTKSLRLKAYKSWAINDSASAEAIERLKKLERYDKLKAEGCSRHRWLTQSDLLSLVKTS